MLRRLKQLRKDGTEARNRRRQQCSLRFTIIRWASRDSWLLYASSWTGYLCLLIQLHVPWVPANTPHRKNWVLHLFSYITLQWIILQCNVLSYIGVGLRHSITLLFFFFAAIDNCNDSPCLNNGTCNHLQDGFSCDCAQGFTGSSCQGNSVLISFQLRRIK